MNESLKLLIELIRQYDGINDKLWLVEIVAKTFGLTRDRSVYYCTHYAIRFSSSSSRNFGNTVLSLSNLRKYDERPFIVCIVTPTQNFCIIANTTFLKKISHSSQEFRVNNIRGSFNGSDIMRVFEGIENCAENIIRLFNIHSEIGFEGNLPRLVEATNNISPSGVKFYVSNTARRIILAAPSRAINFVISHHATTLKSELDEKVSKYRNEILLASLIENVNVRGRIIEYLIAGDDEDIRQSLITALKSDTNEIPVFKTNNALGDYQRKFDAFDTETDIKTKIMILNSNPKAYNLDKMLEFLAGDYAVFMFYFIGMDPGKIVKTILVSMFQRNLLESTILLRHWAGRNSRGVTQFEGKAINQLIEQQSIEIDEIKAREFLEEIIAL